MDDITLWPKAAPPTGSWQDQLPDHIDLNDPPVGAFDAFAILLAAEWDLPFAMVNWFDGIISLFVGLAHPQGNIMPPVERTMPALTHGYCPVVVRRRKPLVLYDTLAMPEFASNPVIDELGVRYYQGMPLIDPRTQRLWGTICGIGPNPRSRNVWRPAQRHMEHKAKELVTAVCERSAPQ
ncbi:GAF domain-containing protein [Streptomyces spectabilis]|uniref:GAF domain-containing protein n=1 Tax=Streptomyces spectabilis TaxID=68270 RepID=UPI0033E8BFF7